MRKNMVFNRFLILTVFCFHASLAWGHSNVSPDYAKQMMDTNNDLIIVDVREPGEYCGFNGHIPGAVNYPWNSGVLQVRYTELSVDSALLVVCGSGHRSNLAASFLDSQDYRYVYDMLGGMSAWTSSRIGCVDTDGDGINDDLDNCPAVLNADQEDGDGDKIGTVCDNCPTHYNRHQMDCDADGIGDICDLDTTDPDADGVDTVCDNCLNTHNPDQADAYPPHGNGIGDACECEGNFDCDVDCDGTDAASFKLDFGRSAINRPCANDEPCNGDFSCDGNVSGSDAALFKADFGRNSVNKPCSSCDPDPWCAYPQ